MALVAVAVLAACGSPSDGPGNDPTPGSRSSAGEGPSHWAPDSYPEEGAPFVEADVAARDIMVTVPETVVAGSSVEVVFPGGVSRGPGFVIERRGDDGWVWLWAAISDTDAPAPAEPVTAERFRDERWEWADGPAFDSGDPHRIRIPEEAELGLYRICTAPDQPAFCAEVEVVESAGLGRALELPVEATDRIEVRQVLVDGLDPEGAEEGAGSDGGGQDGNGQDGNGQDGNRHDGGAEHPTPFGRSAATIGVLLPDDAGFGDLVAQVAEVRRIETGNVTYDLANPEVEVIFLDGDQVLARLGYYLEVGVWGEHAVPGRWADEQWRLLAMTTELPNGSLESLQH